MEFGSERLGTKASQRTCASCRRSSRVSTARRYVSRPAASAISAARSAARSRNRSRPPTATSRPTARHSQIIGEF